ncbi:Histidine kinase [Friedmanniella luteola]|uniref:histidine kinase n=1 Tax=Friedmanniella luteola TaxID=546871 RepID=A0A1H1Z5A9_9ACTN|nr:histidine kinase [Friedmanniella luteola]SDT28406.1 Histidine kinase [Friedmanniella luteola]
MPDRPAPPPLTRFQEGWRLTVAALGGLLLWVGQFGTNDQPVVWFAGLDLLLGSASVVAVHWRRRWPATVAWLTTLTTAFSSTAGVAGALAYVSLVTTRRWKAIVPVSVAGLGTGSLYELVAPGSGLPGDELPWWTTLVFLALFTAVALVAGLYIGARRDLVQSYRDRAETAEREQAARVEQARMGERARIAREMHDVLAHRISLVALHAGAMTYRTDLGAEELRSSARVVQENAHLALSELRDVLGVLRDRTPGPAAVGPGPSPPQPQPTLADLPALVRETREAGTPVQVAGRLADPAALPDAVGRTAFRVVQEALTNARKHAPGCPVVLRLDGTPGARLEVEVSNPLLRSPVPAGDRAWGPAGLGAASPVPGAGLGLVGLAERVGLAGGGLVHGPAAGRYEVRAWLPWPA